METKIIEALKEYGKVLTERQKMHISVQCQIALSTVRAYLAGNAAKEKTAIEILAECKKLKNVLKNNIAA